MPGFILTEDGKKILREDGSGHLMLEKATYAVYVDWNGNGLFDHAYSDISAYLLSIPHLSQGRKSDVDHDTAGKAKIILDNSTGIFSSNNTSSPIYGLMLPNRRIKSTMTYADASPETTITIWPGLLIDIEVRTPETANVSKAIMNAQGVLSQFAESESDIALQSSKKTSELTTTILDADSWPAGDREIGTGLSTLLRWWPNRGLSRKALKQDLQDMEAPPARLREGRDFKVTFDPRDHIFNAPHDTAQATYGTGTLNIWDIRQIDNQRDICNEFVAKVKPLYKTGTIDILTICDVDNDLGGDPILLPAGDTVTVWVDLYEQQSKYKLVQTWNTPEFEANTQADAGGSDESGDVNVTLTGYATRAKLVMENTHGSNLYMVKLILPGVAILFGDTTEVRSSDSASQTKYGKRKWPHAGTKYTTVEEAQAHGDHIISIFKDPRTRLQFTVKANYDATHLEEVMEREIGDRIHVTAGADYGLYVDDDFIIDSIRHDISNFFDHKMIITCTAAPTAELAATSDTYTIQTWTDPDYIEVGGAAADVNAGDGLDDIDDGNVYSKYRTNGLNPSGYAYLTYCSGDQDDIDDGTVYGKLRNANLSGGYLHFTSDSVADEDTIAADRGDPSSDDFGFIELTEDDNWNDLDLSSIVPSGYRWVKLRALVEADVTKNAGIRFRENGNSNAINAGEVRSYSPSYSDVQKRDITVKMDSNRKIEYQTINGSDLNDIGITVSEYWL